MFKEALVLLVVASALLAGCENIPEPSRFDISCAAVVGAFQDEKVPTTVQDCGMGVVRGSKDGIDVSATLHTLQNGAVQVKFHTGSRNQALINRIAAAYDRRMGR